LALLGVVAGETVFLQDRGHVVDEADGAFLGLRADGLLGGEKHQGQDQRQADQGAQNAPAKAGSQHGVGSSSEVLLSGGWCVVRGVVLAVPGVLWVLSRPARTPYQPTTR